MCFRFAVNDTVFVIITEGQKFVSRTFLKFSLASSIARSQETLLLPMNDSVVKLTLSTPNFKYNGECFDVLKPSWYTPAVVRPLSIDVFTTKWSIVEKLLGSLDVFKRLAITELTIYQFFQATVRISANVQVKIVQYL